MESASQMSLPVVRKSAQSVPALSAGAVALGAIAFGATALGALAVGRLAIGALALRLGRVRSLEIDELREGRLHIRELVVDRD